MNKSESNQYWSNFIRPQPMFDVLEKALHQESLGNYVARMEIGDTIGFKNEHIHELVAAEANREFRYSPSAGDGSLIDAVKNSQWGPFDSSKYQVSIAPANFLITAALAALTKPGDLVLLPNPGFPTYKLSCDFLHLKIAYYDVDEKFGPRIDENYIGSEVNESPAVVIVNNPSNPLGLGFSKEKFNSFLDQLESKNIKVINDETYSNLIYDNTDVVSFRPGGIRIRTFSKEHCAPGLRIGYTLAENEQAKTINDFISLTISCAPQFIQVAIAKYLNSSISGDFLSEVKLEMSRRFDYLASVLPEQVFLTKPNAAFYAFLEVGDGDAAFKSLISDNVSTCPGSKFGSNGNSKIRVSLAGSAITFETDIEMLSRGLNKFLNL